MEKYQPSPNVFLTQLDNLNDNKMFLCELDISLIDLVLRATELTFECIMTILYINEKIPVFYKKISQLHMHKIFNVNHRFLHKMNAWCGTNRYDIAEYSKKPQLQLE